jgi:tRNA modification GTPase
MSENKCIIIFNKSDLGRALSVQDFQKHSCVQCCLTKGIGVEYVKLAIGRKLKLHGNDTAGATISERHRKYIQNALNVMNEGSGLINMENEKDWVLVAQLLRTAIENVGEITGRSYNNEVLDNVFERFCTGK